MQPRWPRSEGGKRGNEKGRENEKLGAPSLGAVPRPSLPPAAEPRPVSGAARPHVPVPPVPIPPVPSRSPAPRAGVGGEGAVKEAWPALTPPSGRACAAGSARRARGRAAVPMPRGRAVAAVGSDDPLLLRQRRHLPGRHRPAVSTGTHRRDSPRLPFPVPLCLPRLPAAPRARACAALTPLSPLSPLSSPAPFPVVRSTAACLQANFPLAGSAVWKC